MQLMIIAAIFVAIAGVIFAMQNNVPVTVNFLLWQFDSSLAMVLLLALAAGAIIIALLTTPKTVRRQWLLARQKKRIEELEKETQFQKAHIAELEKNVAVPEENTAPVSPYVGLKEIIMSHQPDSSDEKDKPAP